MDGIGANTGHSTATDIYAVSRLTLERSHCSGRSYSQGHRHWHHVDLSARRCSRQILCDGKYSPHRRCSRPHQFSRSMGPSLHPSTGQVRTRISCSLPLALTYTCRVLHVSVQLEARHQLHLQRPEVLDESV